MVTGTINALEVTRLFDIERLIFFSSIGALPTIQYDPVDCNHPTIMAAEGPGVYGAAKVAGEAFCWAYRQSYNIDSVAIRPTATCGVGTRNQQYLNPIVEGALRGKPVHFDHGHEVPRDYVHVDDVGGITLAALDAPAAKLHHRGF